MSFLQKVLPKNLPLTRYERKISDPCGLVEEGLLEEIFTRITPESKFCVEFGAGDGRHFSFAKNLIERHGWSALLIEADAGLSEISRAYYDGRRNIHTIRSLITAENIESLFSRAGVPAKPGFMLIDIDGNDYHVWKAIQHYTPAVVIIEYNPSYGSGEEFVVDYKPDFVWRRDDYYGASFASLVKLAAGKGYVLIHCSSDGDNLVFVRDEFASKFELPRCPADFYQIAQYGKNGRLPNGKGHPVSKINSTISCRLFCRARYWFMSPVRKLAKILKVAHAGEHPRIDSGV